eukprot:TRINITY_DN26557_c0_g1_i1.p1 TRINITY_DN26557_c0_g1~~TRINITY_DN26557_c0_g1_i1.p1  ORF type:complete len:151 (+),score=12.47 TRINITY_DN26557_c0_g1_i1:400-852(+)
MLRCYQIQANSFFSNPESQVQALSWVFEQGLKLNCGGRPRSQTGLPGPLHALMQVWTCMFMFQLFVLLIVEITIIIQVLISMFPFILTRFGSVGVVGTILGLVYAQTRNLLAPIAMHACWNLGVIVLLTYLQLQGYEIEKYVLWIHHLVR